MDWSARNAMGRSSRRRGVSLSNLGKERNKKNEGEEDRGWKNGRGIFEEVTRREGGGLV